VASSSSATAAYAAYALNPRQFTVRSGAYDYAKRSLASNPRRAGALCRRRSESAAERATEAMAMGGEGRCDSGRFGRIDVALTINAARASPLTPSPP
jgi:hypothetical protein